MTSDTPAGRRFRVFSRRRGAPSKARRRLGAAVRMVAALALGVKRGPTRSAWTEDVLIALGSRNQRLSKFWLTDQGGAAPAPQLKGRTAAILEAVTSGKYPRLAAAVASSAAAPPPGDPVAHFDAMLVRMLDGLGNLCWLYAPAPGQPDPTPSWEGGSDEVFSTLDEALRGLGGLGGLGRLSR